MSDNAADSNETPNPDQSGTAQTCQKCGSLMDATQHGEVCPACLLQVGFESDANENNVDATAGPDEASLNEEDSPEAVQSLFPGLEILERIGQGGMGIVYKARQKHLGRLVALKLLRAKCSGDPSLAERFTREARALAKLSHPNIVGVHDFGQAGDRPYLIMEYVDGVNLRSMLASKSLDPIAAMAMVPAICEALQFAHEEGVVHRDIKPENILVDRRGRVRIADFGLARLMTRSKDEWTLTGTRQVMGTPHYMAPEQIERPQDVDHRADIYSLGVVIYEMLTGELPIGRFELPSHKIDVDIRFDDIVLRTLEKEPLRRYQHVTEVQTAVENIATDPKLARGATGSDRSRAWGVAISNDAFIWIAALGMFAAAIVDLGGAIALFGNFMQRPYFSLFLGFVFETILAVVLGLGGWQILNQGSRKWLWTAVLAIIPFHYGFVVAWPFAILYLILYLIRLRLGAIKVSDPHTAAMMPSKLQAFNDGLAVALATTRVTCQRIATWLTSAWPVIWRKVIRVTLLASLWFAFCALASFSLYWFYGRSRFPTLIRVSDWSARSTLLPNSDEIRLSVDSQCGQTHTGYEIQPEDLKRNAIQFSLYLAAYRPDLRGNSVTTNPPAKIYMSQAFQAHLTSANTIEYEITHPYNVYGITVEPSVFRSKPNEYAKDDRPGNYRANVMYGQASTLARSYDLSTSANARLQYRPQLMNAAPIEKWLATAGMTKEQATPIAAGLYDLVVELANTGGLVADSTGQNKLKPISDMLDKELFAPQSSPRLSVAVTSQAWAISAWVYTTIGIALVGMVAGFFRSLSFKFLSDRRSDKKLSDKK